MNTHHSFLFLLAIVLAVKYTFAKVTVDTQCKNGYLIQKSNNFECKCNDGFVVTNENTCEEKKDCKVEQNMNKPCGDYAVCTFTRGHDTQRAALCTCIPNYIPLNNVCSPRRCDGVICGKGKCMLDPDNSNSIICSCDIGTVLDDSKKCTKPGETKCQLKCKGNEQCKLTDNYYQCPSDGSGGQGSGGEGNGGEGSGGSTGAAYSLMNGSAVISILVVFSLFMMSLL
ncbi:28 kDa ookinete surface protein, putative [Plasmodium knowlesi strain H]|uniref:28 kDa ookinete surface protein, putative n=3 Tax=Plasmodium knowlesi TaxID=5850 RepID=A0A5K1UFJ6_PLAKH|nr:ookinete surface protein P28, putative [Plasmodium knowlesi strain H]AND94996.1 ookinete surface protein P28 [Plasmodium knowlesi]AND94997.1 ookinete surface protein P28 [Plasmodium knowlesi]AND94998.1 ookinete surface protein P28 [Plasmodium knowlesi]AND94999.1 ookinete surface protein P28 [Plasmodium knowlesi]OTN68183.1 surface protein P28 [Plasmodium knowlesi]|eukprot:XP_002261827.1 Ookinete surface protein Pos28-1, putative [Plasmodium knowlesi strain H]